MAVDDEVNETLAVLVCWGLTTIEVWGKLYIQPLGTLAVRLMVELGQEVGSLFVKENE